MSFLLIQRLKKRSVPFLVSPYEADAQLAYLSRQGVVDAVISEDSDLVPYGCARVLYKMDRQGNGVEIARECLDKCTDVPLRGWTDDMVLKWCILAGCDYLPSLNGMGIKGAHAMVRRAFSSRGQNSVRLSSCLFRRFTVLTVPVCGFGGGCSSSARTCLICCAWRASTPSRRRTKRGSTRRC